VIGPAKRVGQLEQGRLVQGHRVKSAREPLVGTHKASRGGSFMPVTDTRSPRRVTSLGPALVASLREDVGPLLARPQATMIEPCRSWGRMPEQLCRHKDHGRRVAG